jgi:hypothetical protein
MIYWSVAAGFMGVLLTGLWIVNPGRQISQYPPEVYWVLGTASLFPAWLIAVLGLLNRMTGRFPEMAVAAWWIMSGAAAVLGVIVADALASGLRESGHPYRRARYWLVGVGTFFPAWCIGLLGLAWTSLGEGR